MSAKIFVAVQTGAFGCYVCLSQTLYSLIYPKGHTTVEHLSVVGVGAARPRCCWSARFSESVVRVPTTSPESSKVTTIRPLLVKQSFPEALRNSEPFRSRVPLLPPCC